MIRRLWPAVIEVLHKGVKEMSAKEGLSGLRLGPNGGGIHLKTVFDEQEYCRKAMKYIIVRMFGMSIAFNGRRNSPVLNIHLIKLKKG